MDKINFIAKDDFPVSTDTLNRLQEATSMVANMALLGGTNYILSGCAVAGSKAAPGVIVLNGEILPFIGGDINSHISIQETKITLDAFDEKYPEAYINRVAVFSDDGVYKWDDLKQVLTNLQLQQRFDSIKGDIPGITKGWAGFEAKIPQDYMFCDGRALLIADYPELYENIGVLHGGDGVTYFNLPKSGGRVAVGYDASKEAYNKIGTTGGSETETLTEQQIPEHDHVRSALFNKLSAKAGDIDTQSSPGSIDPNNAQAEYNVGSMNEARWVEATIKKVGGNQPHNNMQPYYVEGKIIKVK